MHPALVRLLVHTVTFQVRDPAALDDRGNTTGAWVDDLTNVPAKVEWSGGNENRSNREVTDKTHRVFVKGDVPVTEAHRIVFGSRLFEITWVGIRYDQFGAEHHRTIMCEEVK